MEGEEGGGGGEGDIMVLAREILQVNCHTVSYTIVVAGME